MSLPECLKAAEGVQLEAVAEEPGGDPEGDPSVETLQTVGMPSQHQELGMAGIKTAIVAI